MAKATPKKTATTKKAAAVKFPYFVCDYGPGGKDISSSKPAQATEAKILDAIQDLRAIEGNFLGIIVPSGTLQFYCEGDKWLIDVPLPEKGGSLQHRVKVDDMETTRMEYAKAVFAGKAVTELPKLKFQKF